MGNKTHVSKSILEGLIDASQFEELEKGMMVIVVSPYSTGGRVMQIKKGGYHYATIEDVTDSFKC